MYYAAFYRTENLECTTTYQTPTGQTRYTLARRIRAYETAEERDLACKASTANRPILPVRHNETRAHERREALARV